MTRSPAIKALTELAMRRLGVSSARQLADELGWAGHDAERKARRLLDGETDCQFSTIAPMLVIAGLLDEEARAAVATVSQELAEAARRLEGVSADQAPPVDEPRAQDG
jgi:hypothetical protein